MSCFLSRVKFGLSKIAMCDVLFLSHTLCNFDGPEKLEEQQNPYLM